MRERVMRALRPWVAACLGLVYVASAHADLANDVQVSLVAPGGIVGDSTPFTFTQLAPLATGITAGDGGDIGNFMLTGEEIRFSGDSLLVHLAAGADGVTGYLGLGGERARYVFNGLAIAGRQITGFNVQAFDGYGTSGFSGLASPDAGSLVHLLSPSSLSVDLDTLLFVSRGLGTSMDYAELRIDLISTAAVPEPATALMVLAGLGVLVLPRRRPPQQA